MWIFSTQYVHVRNVRSTYIFNTICSPCFSYLICLMSASPGLTWERKVPDRVERTEEFLLEDSPCPRPPPTDLAWSSCCCRNRPWRWRQSTSMKTSHCLDLKGVDVQPGDKMYNVLYTWTLIVGQPWWWCYREILMFIKKLALVQILLIY